MRASSTELVLIARYEGRKHGSFGNTLLLLSIALAVLDSLGLIRRVMAFYRNGDRSWASFKSHVLSHGHQWLDEAHKYEMVGLMEQDRPRAASRQRVVFAIGDDEDEEETGADEHVSQRRDSRDSPVSRDSTGSDGTLHDRSPISPLDKRHSRAGAFDYHHEEASSRQSATWTQQPSRLTLKRFGEIVLVWLRRFQIVFAYVVTLFGFTIYLVSANSFPGSKELTNTISGHVSRLFHQRLCGALHQGQHILWVSR